MLLMKKNWRAEPNKSKECTKHQPLMQLLKKATNSWLNQNQKGRNFMKVSLKKSMTGGQPHTEINLPKNLQKRSVKDLLHPKTSLKKGKRQLIVSKLGPNKLKSVSLIIPKPNLIKVAAKANILKRKNI